MEYNIVYKSLKEMERDYPTIIFNAAGTPIFHVPMCARCKHIIKDTFTCEAFPEEIPKEILYGEINHDKPLPEQKSNFVFEENL